ncbi:MAG TPA: RNA polymerase sigma factor SigJ [Rhizomicrobium sp.]|jgi:RNA polymerase sigma-70 factor (ECF subfamily)
MTDSNTTLFEQHRAHLLGIAYRMLGEMSGAEDLVQEAWLRWRREDPTVIRNPRAWLSAVTVRLALDALRSARARRETYVGPWLPEPIMPDDMRALAADTPAAHAELASDLSLALLHVLERLSPEERAALILHDAFDCDYAEIAEMLSKNETACRKLVSRARERVKSDRPRYTVSKDQHTQMIGRFAQAMATGDTSNLSGLLAEDVVFYSDGGGRVSAALNPIFGADKVNRLIEGLSRKLQEHAAPTFAVTEINGQPSFIIMVDCEIYSTMTIETDEDRITGIYVMRNPDKLTRVARALTPASPSRGSSPSA